MSRRIYVPFILSYSVINRHEHCIRYTMHMDHFTLHCMDRVDWSVHEGTGALWGDSTAAQCPPWSQSRPEVKMASLPDLTNVVGIEEKSNTIYFDCLQFYGRFIYEETSVGDPGWVTWIIGISFKSAKCFSNCDPRTSQRIHVLTFCFNELSHGTVHGYQLLPISRNFYHEDGSSR